MIVNTNDTSSLRNAVLPFSTEGSQNSETEPKENKKSSTIESVQLPEGSNQEISIRDIGNKDNVSNSMLSTDKPSYKLGENSKITVNDPEANLDKQTEETVLVILTSDGDPKGIVLELKETSPNSGVYEGSFSTTTKSSSGSQIHAVGGDHVDVHYLGTHPRFQAEFSSVTKGGTAQITDYAVPPTESKGLFDPIGGAVNVTLAGAEVDPGGTIKVTLSYANVALANQFPDSLTIMENVGGGSWVDLRMFVQIRKISFALMLL